MKKATSVFFLLLVSCSGVKETWPYFWKIEKNGKTSYALGAMHITTSLNELPCANYIKSRLKESDLLLSEYSSAWLNILKAEKPIETDSELKHLYTQNGFDLMYDEDGSDFLQLESSIQNFFRGRGVSSKLSHSGYVLATAAFWFAEAYDHSTIQKSAEKELVEIAKFSNIPVKPLDTIELRHRMFSYNTLEEVERRVRGFSHCPGSVAQFKNQYISGNMPVSQFDEGYARVTFRDRHKEWLAKFISAQQSHDSIFMAAGLAHFTGPYNLLEMLRDKGFVINVSSCNL